MNLEIIHFKKVKSTNTEAIQLAKAGCPSGTVVVADHQTAGRGRLGRSWMSSKGKGLYCSFVIRPKLSLEHLSKITFLAGLAVAEALEKLDSKLSVGLKWPNDLYVNGKKLGGILTESSSLQVDSNDLFVVIGIGVNILHDLDEFDEDIRKRATSLLVESKKSVSVNDIINAVHIRLKYWLEIAENQGFVSIMQEWRLRDILCGREVEMIDIEGNVAVGKALEVSDDGLLFVEKKSGEVVKIFSGDVQIKQEKAP